MYIIKNYWDEVVKFKKDKSPMPHFENEADAERAVVEMIGPSVSSIIYVWVRPLKSDSLGKDRFVPDGKVIVLWDDPAVNREEPCEIVRQRKYFFCSAPPPGSIPETGYFIEEVV